jgi:hypothetical protein
LTTNSAKISDNPSLFKQQLIREFGGYFEKVSAKLDFFIFLIIVNSSPFLAR